MAASDEINHDILLIIVVALAIIFITGLSKPSETRDVPLVVPA